MKTKILPVFWGRLKRFSFLLEPLTLEIKRDSLDMNLYQIKGYIFFLRYPFQMFTLFIKFDKKKYFSMIVDITKIFLKVSIKEELDYKICKFFVRKLNWHILDITSN